MVSQGLLEFAAALPAEAAVPPAHEQVIGRKSGHVLPIAESAHLSDAGDPVDDTQNGELSNGGHGVAPRGDCRSGNRFASQPEPDDPAPVVGDPLNAYQHNAD